MRSDDPMDRLAAADPVPPGSLASREAPAPPSGPQQRRPRWRRIAGPALAALGALAMVVLIGALVIAAPGDHPTSTFDGTLRVSILQRPQAPEDRLTLPPAAQGADLDPASTRRAATGDRIDWFVATPRGDPGSVCVVQARGGAVNGFGCRGIAELGDGVLASRWVPFADGLPRGPESIVGVLVPDGIDSVTVAGRAVPVRDNLAVMEFPGPVPTIAVLSGPAAIAVRPAPGVTVESAGAPPAEPAVAVLLAPGGVVIPGEAATAPPAGPADLRVALLERPQAPEDMVAVPPPFERRDRAIDPASIRLALDRGAESWYAGRLASDPTSICLWHTAPLTDVGCYGMDPLEGSGIVTLRWLPEGLSRPLDELVSELVGIAPDGIDSVTIGDENVPVVDNVFAIRVTGPPPEYAVASGPAALALPRTAPNVAVARRIGSPPAAAIALVFSGASPELEPGTTFTTGTPDDARSPVPDNPTIQGTLQQAAAAMPFTVLVPQPAPTAGPTWVQWSREDPALLLQATISYLPAGSGQGITLIEAAEGTTPVGDAAREREVRRGGRTFFVLDRQGRPGADVRVVIDGTDVRISGDGLTEERALAIAASLRPVDAPAP